MWRNLLLSPAMLFQGTSVLGSRPLALSARPTSASMTLSGVRSSCEASAVNSS